MAIIDTVAEHFRYLVGREAERELGDLTALAIKRYALTVGDHNPLYYDREHARSEGHADVVAPPNMLPSIIEWGTGAAEEELRPDGNSPSDDLIPLGDLEGVRVMGGGEEMTFHEPVTAGTRIKLTSRIIDAYTKEGKKGPLAFLVFENVYSDIEGRALCTCKRTLIAR